MRGLVFAAGIGSRLKPWTDSHPKALVEVGNRPVLQHAIDKMGAVGIEEVTVNVHHFADQIEAFLLRYDGSPRIYISDERQALLDTGGGLLKALREMPSAGSTSGSLLLHNADIVTDFPLAEMIQWHRNSKAQVTLMVSERHSSRMLWLDAATHRLVGWQNMQSGEMRPDGFTPGEGMLLQAFGGVHIVDESILPWLEEYATTLKATANIKEIPPFSIIPFYLWALDKGLEISCFTPSGPFRWFDVGMPEKLEAARQAFR